jgi:hypothetical protein
LAIPQDLLAQAKHLANREPKRPRQASLRRAVSAAYYALYHLLAEAGAQTLAPPNPPQLRSRIRRAFSHADMKRVCSSFQHNNVENLPDEIKPLIIEPLQQEFSIVAETFVQLQEDRHMADYDFSKQFARTDVLIKIDMVDQAFAAWRVVRRSSNANAFLAAMLLHKHWRSNV